MYIIHWLEYCLTYEFHHFAMDFFLFVCLGWKLTWYCDNFGLQKASYIQICDSTTSGMDCQNVHHFGGHIKTLTRFFLNIIKSRSRLYHLIWRRFKWIAFMLMYLLPIIVKYLYLWFLNTEPVAYFWLITFKLVICWYVLVPFGYISRKWLFFVFVFLFLNICLPSIIRNIVKNAKYFYISTAVLIVSPYFFRKIMIKSEYQ